MPPRPDAHSGPTQLHGLLRRVDDNVTPIDQAPTLGDLGGGGQLLLQILVEFPQPAHGRVGDVESALGAPRHLQRLGDDLERLVGNLHRLSTGAGVDPQHVGRWLPRPFPVGHQAFDPADLVERGGEALLGPRVVVRVRRQHDVRPHRVVGPAKDVGREGLGERKPMDRR